MINRLQELFTVVTKKIDKLETIKGRKSTEREREREREREIDFYI